MKKTKLAVMFSGGRTSGYMSYWLINNMQHKYDMTFVFANTGQEHENTLKFVDQCDKAFGLNLNWIEAEVQKKGKGTSYRIVDFDTASRNGRPFEDVVKKFGLPTTDFPHCTRELKIEPFSKYAIDHIGDDFERALGIRIDEPRRLKRTGGRIYPLADDKPMSKGDILLWWRQQEFDLELPEHLGNCTWCWKKSDRKLLTLAKNHPEILEFPKMLESKYSEVSNYHRKDKRFMFRGYKTTDDLLEMSKTNFVEFTEKVAIQPSLDFETREKQLDEYELEEHNYTLDQEECAEECGSVWVD